MLTALNPAARGLLAFHIVMVAVEFFPGAACEIGHFDGSAAVCDRYAAEFAERRPFGSVVYVFIEGQPVEEAIYEAVIHYVVHAAVTAYFACSRFGFGLYGVLVLLHEGGFDIFGHEIVEREVFVVGSAFVILDFAESIAFDGIFVGKAFGACYLIHARIRTGIEHVVLYVDCLSAGGLNHAHGVVAVLEISAFSALFLYDFRAGDGFGIHGDDIVHFVSAVDVDELTCRTYAVGGILIQKI